MAPSNYDPLLPSSHTKKKKDCSCKAFLLLLSISSLLCVAIVITHQVTTKTTNLSRLCTRSPNPMSCKTIIAKVASSWSKPRSDLGAAQVLVAVIHESILHVDAVIVEFSNASRLSNNRRRQSSIRDCIELMDLSRDRLLDSARAVSSGSRDETQTWLSAVLTNYVTCLDGLHGPTSQSVNANLESLTALASASLAIVKAGQPQEDRVIQPIKKFPTWITFSDQKLLEVSTADGIRANAVVAADGSGNFRTVQAAVDAAPNHGKARYVIRVKAGTYKESVSVGKAKTNLMIVGDGMDSTVITGSLNVVDGSTTFNSATLAAVADGFILQDIRVENTAGPEKRQAVALRVGADRSVINRCQINGYQDTLYAHSLRQFYRDSRISGTVDFIFGNAAVVFQNCNIIARKPMSVQQNTVTAQGRTDPNQNTGTSIQSCRVTPSPDLVPVKSTILSFLGRPWKQYSRTVFMQSYIGDHIAPKGWLEWDGDFALKTLFYGEYANFGPGAGTRGRVNWPGYHVITDPNVARQFTVAGLIQGGSWLGSTGVDFTEGL